MPVCAKCLCLCSAPRAETPHTFPTLPFLLTNRDNMQPKSDNTKWHHQWLKGLSYFIIYFVYVPMHSSYILNQNWNQNDPDL